MGYALHSGREREGGGGSSDSECQPYPLLAFVPRSNHSSSQPALFNIPRGGRGAAEREAMTSVLSTLGSQPTPAGPPRRAVPMATGGEAALLALARSSEGQAATAQELAAPSATAQESAAPAPSVPLTYQEVRERAPLTYEEAREQALQEARAEGIMLVNADNASGFANVY